MSYNLHVMQLLPTLRTGGAERLVADLSVALKAAGVRVTLVTMFPEEQTPNEKRINAAAIPRYSLGKRLGLDLRMFARIYRLMQKLKPDVLHAHLYSLRYAIPAIILNRSTAAVYTVHSIPSKEDKLLALHLYRLAFRYRLVQPVAVSPSIASYSRAYYGTSIAFPVIPNGIQLAVFACTPRPVCSTRKRVVFLNVGRLVDVKNQAFLLRVARKLKDAGVDFELRIAGEGPLRQSLEEQARYLCLQSRVRFLGVMPEMAPVYSSADIFVLPSLHEGLPVSLLEAMAARLAVVASAVGGIPDVVHHGRTGLLLPPRDEELWVAALQRLVADVRLREELAEAGHAEVVGRYDIESAARAYLQVYESLVRAEPTTFGAGPSQRSRTESGL